MSRDNNADGREGSDRVQDRDLTPDGRGVHLGAEFPEWLADMVKNDPRSNSDILRAGVYEVVAVTPTDGVAIARKESIDQLITIRNVVDSEIDTHRRALDAVENVESDITPGEDE